MRIEFTCKCGASMIVDDPSTVNAVADKWREDHKHCKEDTVDTEGKTEPFALHTIDCVGCQHYQGPGVLPPAFRGFVDKPCTVCKRSLSCTSSSLDSYKAVDLHRRKQDE